MGKLRALLPIFRKFSGYAIGRFYPTRLLWRYAIGRFYPTRLLWNSLLPQLTATFAEVQGHKMFLDTGDFTWLSLCGIYEPLTTELFKRRIKRGDVVLDIGAFIGYYTLIAARLVGENGKVFAFEPDPTNFQLLRKNVSINCYENVIAVQKAVSDRTGKTKLYLSKDNPGDHRIYESYDRRQSIEIEAIRLDDYFKNYERKIDFIKMDVQGAEEFVIRGMPLVLQKNRNIEIVIEFWPIGLKRSGVEPEEHLKSLVECSFKIYDINEQKRKVELSTIGELVKTYKDRSTNLFLTRQPFPNSS